MKTLHYQLLNDRTESVKINAMYQTNTCGAYKT